MDIDNEPQPDALLRIEGKQSRIDDDGYVAGAPELVVEIVITQLVCAASSAAYDLQEKLQVYRRNGVREYIVWQVSDRVIDWFYLQEGEYIKLQPNEGNTFKSQVFPGLWLEIDCLLNYDLSRVIEVLQRGLATQEHQDFINGQLP